MTTYHDHTTAQKRWHGTMAHHAIRLRDPATGEYLHMSGTGRVKGVDGSWLGLPHQARELRRRALNDGEEWPWRAVGRDEG